MSNIKENHKYQKKQKNIMTQRFRTFSELGEHIIMNCQKKIKLDQESYSSLVKQFAEANKSEEITKIFLTGQHLEAKIQSKQVLSLLGNFLFDSIKDKNDTQMTQEDFSNILSQFQLEPNIEAEGAESSSDDSSKKQDQVAVKVRKAKRVGGAKKLDQASVTDKKIQKIKEVLEKKAKAQLDKIEKYQNFKKQLEKNKKDENDDENATDDEKLKAKKRFPCFEEQCPKRYESEKARKLHIIKKHLILAVERKYIKYLCEICEQYGTNSISELEQHEEGCAAAYAGNLEIAGVYFEQKELSEKQKQLLKEASRFC